MTTTTDKATPRPWTYHANYIEVSNEHGDHSLYAPDDRGAVSPETRWANARFVVQAVNAHDDLVAALSGLRSELSSYMGIVTVDEGEWSELWAALALVNTALAKAEGA